MRRLTSMFVALLLWAIVVPLGAAGEVPDPQQPALSTLTVPELERQADALRVQKDYQEAIRYYKAAIRKDKKNAVLYNKMGLAELQLAVSDPRRNLSAPKSDFEKASKLNRNYAEAINNLGVIEYFQKNYSRAVRYYKKALALKEDSASFHANLGAAWFALDNLERASTEYIRALQLDPEVLQRLSTGGISAQATSAEDRAKYSFFLARMYARAGDLDRCLEWLKKAKEEGYSKMGDVYREVEFAAVRQDARLAEVVPAPTPK